MKKLKINKIKKDKIEKATKIIADAVDLQIIKTLNLKTKRLKKGK